MFVVAVAAVPTWSNKHWQTNPIRPWVSSSARVLPVCVSSWGLPKPVFLCPVSASCSSPRIMPRISPGLHELCVACQMTMKRQAGEAPKPEEGL
eukprot:1821090-Alexandrium_andersonii.AAC.1